MTYCHYNPQVPVVYWYLGVLGCLSLDIFYILINWFVNSINTSLFDSVLIRNVYHIIYGLIYFSGAYLVKNICFLLHLFYFIFILYQFLLLYFFLYTQHWYSYLYYSFVVYCFSGVNLHCSHYWRYLIRPGFQKNSERNLKFFSCFLGLINLSVSY